MPELKYVTKETLVQILDNQLYGWCYKDIEKATAGDAKLPGFILGCCFVDVMAGFYAGIDQSNYRDNSSQRFKDFVIKYMPKYDAEKLYTDLRCGLVHAYAEGGTYVFTHENKVGFHFNSTSYGRIILNLEDFLADLREAYKKFRQDILDDNDLFLKATKRLGAFGIMGPAKIEDV